MEGLIAIDRPYSKYDDIVINIPLACDTCSEHFCRQCRVFWGYITLYAKLLDTEEERVELARFLGLKLGYQRNDDTADAEV